jgi:prephenate dehydrogenase
LTGPEHARADLFDGRVVVVTPTERTQPADLAEVREFWGLLGARVIEMSPLEHDAAVAVTSHLPHLAAAAIARSTPERYAALVAGGWLDSTRIAAGDPQLWTQILRSNRTSVQSAAAGFRQALDEFQAALEADDPAALENLLTKAKRTRDALGS